MIATQIYLTITETVCCVALFSGYLEDVARNEQGKKLPVLVLGEKGPCTTGHNKNISCCCIGIPIDMIKLTVLAIKLQHIQFTVYDMMFGGSSFFGDYYRNCMFTIEDILFLWLFLWTYMIEKSTFEASFKVVGMNLLVWIGLFASQSVFGSNRVT